MHPLVLLTTAHGRKHRWTVRSIAKLLWCKTLTDYHEDNINYQVADMFLRNYWYVAAFGHEIGRNLLARTILGDKIVLYRTEDGSPIALANRCCHRQAPLSMGRLIGDTVECGYHGLIFDTSGECVRVPGQKKIPPGAKVHKYPVAERWRWIWIWMGDPDLADEALIPDHLYRYNDDPEWSCVEGYLHVKADYMLLVDNLMDLSHETFLHSKTIGTVHVAETPAQVAQDNEGVTVTRWMLDRPPPPIYDKSGGFSERGETVDRWQIVRFEPPSNCCLDVGVATAGTGAPEGDRSKGISMRSLNFLTPETERSTHYFWTFPRDYKLDDEEISKLHAKGFQNTFTEDLVMLEAQQEIIDAHEGQPTVNINIDKTTMPVRRMVDKLLNEQELISI